jgi:Rod binding domain-containing protein
MDIAAPQAEFKPPAALRTADRKKAEAAAKEFEGMIIGQLLEPMWAGVKTDGAFGGGTGEMVFRSLMIQEMGKDIANSGGIGLADDIMRTMLQMQEGARK